jgi:hypothetical protein
MGIGDGFDAGDRRRGGDCRGHQHQGSAAQESYKSGHGFLLNKRLAILPRFTEE